MTNQNSKITVDQRIHNAEQIYQRLLNIPIREVLKPNADVADPALDLNVRVWNQAMLCRVREFGGAVLELHRKNQHVSAAILTRSLLETVALYYHIFTGLKSAIDTGNTKEAIKKLWKAGMGSYGGARKSKDKDGHIREYDAIRIEKFAKEFCELIPPARCSYDQLSEMTHPNFSGVVFAYTEPDQQNLSFKFGKDFGHIKINYDYVLEFAVAFFEMHYAEMDKLITEFMKLLK